MDIATIAKAAIGIILLIVVAGGLLYFFYSRTNAVEKTGYGSLAMLALISLLIPLFWIMEGQNQLTAKNDLEATAIERGMHVYADNCVDGCYGIVTNAQGEDSVVNATYNGYQFPALNQYSDDEIRRIVSAGIYNPAKGTPKNPNLIPKAEQYGGALASNDIDYLIQFIRSTGNPAWAQAQDPPFTGQAAINGLKLVPEYLQTNNKTLYDAAKKFAQFGQFGEPQDKTSAKEVTIEIVDPGTNGVTCSSTSGCYTPINVKVKVGTKITWVNKSKVGHTVTAIEGQDVSKIAKDIFDSANGSSTNLIPSGGSFTWTVTKAAYDFNATTHAVSYFCRVHPDMVAELVIVE